MKKQVIKLNAYDDEEIIIVGTANKMQAFLNYIGVMAINARNYCEEHHYDATARNYQQFINQIRDNKDEIQSESLE